MSQFRLQVFPITKYGYLPREDNSENNDEDQEVFFVTTGVMAGVTYVLLDSIKKYFAGEICNVNFNEVIPSHLIKNLGGNGGLDPQTQWTNTQMPFITSGESQFTNSEGVLSLEKHLKKNTGEKINCNDLKDFCIKVFPDFIIDDNYVQHFKDYISFVSDIQNHRKSEYVFPIQTMLQLWMKVVRASSHVTWMSEFIDLLTKESHETIYASLHNFIDAFAQNQIELEDVVCLIMNTYTLVQIDKKRLSTPLNSDTKFKIFSYNPPISNPLQSLLSVQISRISKLKIDETTINRERIEALQKILANNSYIKHQEPSLNCLPTIHPQSSVTSATTSSKLTGHAIKNIDFGKMFKYPNPVIFKYKENEKGVRMMHVFSAYTMFFMEISNREIYDINNTICMVHVHQK